MDMTIIQKVIDATEAIICGFNECENSDCECYSYTEKRCGFDEMEVEELVRIARKEYNKLISDPFLDKDDRETIQRAMDRINKVFGFVRII